MPRKKLVTPKKKPVEAPALTKPKRYNQRDSVDLREAFKTLGTSIRGFGYTDEELISSLEALDMFIGFLDGFSGPRDIAGYAMVVTHCNLLNVARMRGIVE